MKNTILSFSFLVLFFSAVSIQAQEIISESLIKNSNRDGKDLIVNTKTDTPLDGTYKVMDSYDGYYIASFKKGVNDGEYKRYSSKGTISCEGSFSEGKVDKVWKYYDRYGQVERKEIYVKGDPDGTWVYYNNRNDEPQPLREEVYKNKLLVSAKDYYQSGKIKGTESYVDGLKSGKWEEFYNTGLPKSVTNYVKSQKEGPYEEFYEFGDIRQKGEYKDNLPVGTWTTYYKDGSVASKVTQDNATKYYHFEAYYEDGKLRSKGTAIDEKLTVCDGAYETYFNSGLPEEIVHYKKGVKDGESKRYFSNGNVQIEGKYVDGKEEGLFQLFYNDKKPHIITNYKDGKYVGTRKTYFSNGNINVIENYSSTQKGDYGDRYVREGVYETYYEDGKLREEGKYVNDKKNGTWKNYDYDGNLSTAENYQNGEKEGAYELYYQGRIREKYTNKKGKKDGAYLSYYYSSPEYNGILEIEGNYKDGKKAGTWKYYNNDKTLRKTENFDK